MKTQTYEFIDLKDWCMHGDVTDVCFKERTYTTMFQAASVNINEPNFDYKDTVGANEFNNLPTDHSGFTNAKLLSCANQIPPSFIANLGEALVKDSSLLVLVKDSLAITENYGDRRWLDFQLQRFPGSHNVFAASLPVGVQISLDIKIKAYISNDSVANFCDKLIYLSVRENDNNIYHWLFETLPRLKCLDILQQPHEYMLLLRSAPTKFQLETLDLMGIKNKFLITNGLDVKAAKLFLPTIPSPPVMNRELLEWLRQKLISKICPKESGGMRKLYISRRDAGRQLINEKELLEALSPLGFECLVMSELSVTEQITAFKTAAVVVAPHGAALSFMLFAQPSAMLIELIPPKHVSWCYYHLAKTLGQRYKFIFGNHIDSTVNFCINIDQLINLL
jgi:hypothetical protein